MATKPEATKSPVKKTIKYGDKFGLDKERKKLEAGLKNFSITRIVMTESKKRYDHVDSETEETVRGKIGIAQFDCTLEDGSFAKFYSPNSAIVEACENILADVDFGANKEGYLSTPAEIGEVISGKGEKGRNYIAFA
jgi:hypothetical protein